ncbi:hypothetical protein WICPIJ_004685 [Wickerhamomyces pijperi]|uniref:Uncharacterized protein n=1 Tax=Wickerhamomyces pijperi TaxID=599730 RepID=A0A9P8Q7J9_WICPI|nr:hypothetical protein WICPIJ_004685 [Wickerhamomyces pijperi]
MNRSPPSTNFKARKLSYFSLYWFILLKVFKRRYFPFPPPGIKSTSFKGISFELTSVGIEPRYTEDKGCVSKLWIEVLWKHRMNGINCCSVRESRRSDGGMYTLKALSVDFVRIEDESSHSKILFSLYFKKYFAMRTFLIASARYPPLFSKTSATMISRFLISLHDNSEQSNISTAKLEGSTVSQQSSQKSRINLNPLNVGLRRYLSNKNSLRSSSFCFLTLELKV